MGSKKLFFAVVVLCASAFAQNALVPVPPVFLGPSTAPRLGANLTISFCTSTATLNNCLAGLAFAQAYADSTNSNPINQTTTPLKTDALGNAPAFFAAPGLYSFAVSGPGVGSPQGPYQITVSCIPGTTCVAPGANNAFTGNNTHSGTETFNGGILGSAAFGGPSPWIDVTSPTYNAKCDGATDDTTAFNNAISQVNTNGGGTIFVPTAKTCVIAGQLNATLTSNVKLMGIMGAISTGDVKPILSFTGTTCPLVDARSTHNFTVEGLTLRATSGSLSATCRFIDYEHNGANGDTFGALIRNVRINGASPTTVLCLVCLDNADLTEIDKAELQNAINAIRVSTTVNLNVHDSYFSTPGAGTISGAMILGAASSNSATTISNNFFEMGGSGASPTVMDCTNGCPLNTNFASNSIGDAPVAYSGTMLKNIGSGFVVTGNAIFGGTNNAATAISVANNTLGLQISGNSFANFATGIAWPATANNVQVTGNQGGTVTNFQSGAPLSGIVTDFTANKTTIYGASQLNSLSINGGTALTGQVGTGTSVATNTSVQTFEWGCTGTAAAGTTILLNTTTIAPACTNTTNVRPLTVTSSAGVGKNLQVKCTTGGTNASSGVVTVTDNGSNTALTCTLGTGTSCTDSSHSFTIAAGDELQIKMTTQAAETLANCEFAFEKQ